MRFKIQTLNNISIKGLERLPRDRFEVASEIGNPDAILVRSADMHKVALPDSLRAVGRAGAGTNNIPVEALSKKGIPVFNAPGANANAVKELVLAGMFLAARNICQAWSFAKSQQVTITPSTSRSRRARRISSASNCRAARWASSASAPSASKSRTRRSSLGMKVLGYDPQITVQRAWQLSSNVEQALSLDDLFVRSDVISVHVPLTPETRGLVNEARLKLMRKNGVILNFARAPIVDEKAIIAALDDARLQGYVCDFPTNAHKDHPKIVTLPHLGASTNEAEDNCAVMVADTVKDYLENGNIKNSVNFPEVVLPRAPKTSRICIANSNVPNMVGQISTALAGASLNIAELLNKSRGEYAYTLIDTDGAVDDGVIDKVRAIGGVLAARVI